jgi:hypothetical protein
MQKITPYSRDSQSATRVPEKQGPNGECEAPADIAPPALSLHSPQQPQYPVDEQDPAEEQFEQRPQVTATEGDRVGDPFLHALSLAISGVDALLRGSCLLP